MRPCGMPRGERTVKLAGDDQLSTKAGGVPQLEVG